MGVQSKPDLVTGEASNGYRRIATLAHFLPNLLLYRSRRIYVARHKPRGRTDGASRPPLPVIRPRIRRRGCNVINQTPILQEIKHPPNRSHVPHNLSPSLRKRDLLRRACSILVDDRIPVIPVNPRTPRRRLQVEELGKKPSFRFVNLVPRKPP